MGILNILLSTFSAAADSKGSFNKYNNKRRHGGRRGGIVHCPNCGSDNIIRDVMDDYGCLDCGERF